MAGVVGFEPTVHATKKRCLTTWLHPNCGALNTTCVTPAQDPKSNFFLENEFFLTAQNFGFILQAKTKKGAVRLPLGSIGLAVNGLSSGDL